MRDDMAKVIVERERLKGGHYECNGKTPKGLAHKRNLKFYEDEHDRLDSMPKHESMLSPWKLSGRYKSLNENLSPLYRFLHSQVGRPWNKVHSEICKHVKLSSAVQKHILDHVKDYVEQNVRIIDGKVYTSEGNPDTYRGSMSERDLYVCPKSGLLKEVTKKQASYKYSRQFWRTRNQKKQTSFVEADESHQYHKIDGIWYLVELASLKVTREKHTHPKYGWPVENISVYGGRDAVHKRYVGDGFLDRGKLRETYGKEDVYGISKRALNHKELRRLNLVNGDDERKIA